MKITAPGIYRMDAATYHADPCLEPSLSSSIGKVLIERSPMHAHHAHPRLNPATSDRDPSRAMDDGSALHKLILGEGADIVPIKAADYRTAAAKEARDTAREEGKIPILVDRLYDLQVAADAIKAQIEAHPDCPRFADGQPEAALFADDEGIWCRALVDFLPHDPNAPLYDLKTTALSAAPQSWEKRLVSEYAFQAAFYMRIARQLGRIPEAFLFIVAETEPPYAVSVLSPAPSLMQAAEADVERAIALWARCLETNHWPGYPPFTAYVEAPPWLLMKQSDRMLRDEFVKEMTP